MRYEDGSEMADHSAEEPWLYRQHAVPHYYGDSVRQMLLFSAALLLIGAPFYASNLQTQIPIIVLAALILVCLAAFTSPVARRILLADAVASGVGMVLFEIWALSSIGAASALAIGLRQAIALVLMFALYFSGKTLRGLVEPEWEREAEQEREDAIAKEEEDDESDEMRESYEDRDNA